MHLIEGGRLIPFKLPPSVLRRESIAKYYRESFDRDSLFIVYWLKDPTIYARTMNKPINLQSNRLILRPPREEDAPAFTRLAADEAIAENTFVPHPYTTADAHRYLQYSRERWKSGSGAPFVILRRQDRIAVGAISFKEIDRGYRRAELGYWIGRPYWGQGYATEAVRRLLRYGFEELKLHRVFASVFCGNEASRNVLKKAGLKKEGRLCGHVFHRGRYRDLEIYGMTSSPGQKI